MEEYGFYETHYANVRNSKYFGVPVPGPKNAGIGFKLYFLLLVSIDTIVFTLFTIQLLQMKSVIRICVDFIGDFTVLYGLVITIYVAKIAKPFKDLLVEYDDITLSCMNDPLDPKKTFRKRMLSDYKFVEIYAKTSVPIIALCGVGFFALNILRSFKFLGMDGNKVVSVDIWFPHSNRSPNFEISQILGMLGITIGVSQKQMMECFVLSLLTLMCSYLDHLNSTVSNIFITYSSNTNVQQKHNIEGRLENEMSRINHIRKDTEVDINLKSWIKIHQKTLRLSRELTDMLSPLLAFYLVNITSLVAVLIFTISLGEIHFNEFISLFNYVLTNGISLFFMCRYGSKLTEKSIEVSQPAFWKCFQHGGGATRETYKCLTVVFQRTLKPLIIAPFRSCSFELSNTSFISFGWSIISFYLAIKKIKELGSV